MARVTRLSFKGLVERQQAALESVADAGDFALVVRGVPRAIVMKCPDGCGDTLTINLDSRAGKAWDASLRDGILTLYPSVWRNEGCEAHFIVWANRLLWCDRKFSRPAMPESVEAAVLAALQPDHYLHFRDLAEQAGIHPWEALWACQSLEKKGHVKVQDQVFYAANSGPRRSRRKWRFW